MKSLAELTVDGSRRKVRVLVSAYACEPHRGSEPGVGWNLVIELAKLHEVLVITRESNREVIEREVSLAPNPNLAFHYHDLPKWARWWKKGGRGMQVYYYLWQLALIRRVRKLVGEFQPDIVHHLSFGRYWAPSALAFANRPFLWGPLGGGDSAPRALYDSFGWRGRLYEHQRAAARRLAELDPLVRLTARRATLALSSTPATTSRLSRLGTKEVSMMLQMGVSTADMESLEGTSAEARTGFTFVSIGRLLHWKGFHLGLAAFARAEIGNKRYIILGSGPERERLTDQARRLGIHEQVEFLGQIPRLEALAVMKAADALVHPSVHDQSPSVVLEALALGKVVICLDSGGPPFQVGPESGLVIGIESEAQVIRDLSRAMENIANSPNIKRAANTAGPERIAQEFIWERRAQKLSYYYESLASASTHSI